MDREHRDGCLRGTALPAPPAATAEPSESDLLKYADCSSSREATPRARVARRWRSSLPESIYFSERAREYSARKNGTDLFRAAGDAEGFFLSCLDAAARMGRAR